MPVSFETSVAALARRRTIQCGRVRVRSKICRAGGATRRPLRGLRGRRKWRTGPEGASLPCGAFDVRVEAALAALITLFCDDVVLRRGRRRYNGTPSLARARLYRNLPDQDGK
jgi:hypothetical protein